MSGANASPLLERHLDGARLRLPPAARRALGNRVTVTADLSGCVVLTPAGLLGDALSALQRASARNYHAAEYFRFLAATETAVSVDRRGRLSLPRLHREWARLPADRPVVIVSLGHSVQVWNPRRLSMHLRMSIRRLRHLSAHALREQLTLLEQPEASGIAP